MNLKKVDNALFRQFLFLATLVWMGFIIYNQLSFFTGAVLGAFTFYCALRPVLFYLTEKVNLKYWQVSVILVLTSTTLFLLLGYFIFKIVAAEIPTLDAQVIINEVAGAIKNVNRKIGYDIISPDLIAESSGFIMRVATTLLNTTYSLAFNLFMMMFLLYFMFADAKTMERTAYEYSPFKGRSMQMIKTEIRNMITTNAIGIPLILTCQTIAATLGYWIFGVRNPAFWGLMTAIFALIPIIGSAVVWLPMGIYLVVSGHVGNGVAVMIYVALVVGNIDNAIRLILMKKMADTHPLITIPGVILGIPLFGFWGIIFGPILISGFVLLIKIYYEEYGVKNNLDKISDP